MVHTDMHTDRTSRPPNRIQLYRLAWTRDHELREPPAHIRYASVRALVRCTRCTHTAATRTPIAALHVRVFHTHVRLPRDALERTEWRSGGWRVASVFA